MKLVYENVVLLGIVTVALPLVLWLMPRLPSQYGFWVSLGFYAIAAYILNDFGARSGGGDLPDSINLLEAYRGGVTHTLKHIMWPLAINFAFAVAFGALLIQSKGFTPVPMAMWLMTALLVSTIVSLTSMGIAKALASMTPQLWFGFLFAALSCLCMQWHAMSGK